MPLRVQLPTSERPLAGLLLAAQHGEEAETGLLARRLLERVPGDETAWAVVQVANPDGLLNATRQNAAGVDLNRNFPCASWSPEPSYTFPPGIDPELRELPNRTSRSSPGPEPGSEPETQALMALVHELAPPLVVDLHAPIELILVREGVPPEPVELLANATGLPVVSELTVESPGAFDEWLLEQGIPAIVYEVEHAGLPALCKRHLPGLEALLRS
ncbi:MAG TPA: M14 family zinc carboxypeptidase [Gaiellaceae bacterium]|nr:M14 family zinc carboxypeptidase [Gaiellaceae bacterium]